MPSDLEPTGTSGEIFELLAWNDEGLVPVVVQDLASRQVLMVAWADRIAVQRTLSKRLATFFSRSRGRLWMKGEESGNVLHVRELRTDCDGDVLLYLVEPTGPACHRGWTSCFAHRVETDGAVRRD